jgi:GSH-dependent disulfide-bond oxidoreductase
MGGNGRKKGSLMARKSMVRPARRLGPKRASKKVRPARRPVPAKPIALYYWPTPNGYKVSIMLEECRLPYQVIPLNIARGEQFTPAFLAISPKNRMPAIVDPAGPGGRPISVFESGAILQYLGRKTGKFYPASERARVEVDQWLFWQMANLGPKAGECHHFRLYAPERATLQYAVDRFTNECNRLYGVMNRQLADRDFLAGHYSIADMACVGWVSRWRQQGQDIDAFAHLKRWLERVRARPAVDKGMHIWIEEASKVRMDDVATRAMLFNQRAR